MQFSPGYMIGIDLNQPRSQLRPAPSTIGFAIRKITPARSPCANRPHVWVPSSFICGRIAPGRARGGSGGPQPGSGGARAGRSSPQRARSCGHSGGAVGGRLHLHGPRVLIVLHVGPRRAASGARGWQTSGRATIQRGQERSDARARVIRAALRVLRIMWRGKPARRVCLTMRRHAAVARTPTAVPLAVPEPPQQPAAAAQHTLALRCPRAAQRRL